MTTVVISQVRLLIHSSVDMDAIMIYYRIRLVKGNNLSYEVRILLYFLYYQMPFQGMYPNSMYCRYERSKCLASNFVLSVECTPLKMSDFCFKLHWEWMITFTDLYFPPNVYLIKTGYKCVLQKTVYLPVFCCLFVCLFLKLFTLLDLGSDVITLSHYCHLT